MNPFAFSTSRQQQQSVLRRFLMNERTFYLLMTAVWFGMFILRKLYSDYSMLVTCRVFFKRCRRRVGKTWFILTTLSAGDMMHVYMVRSRRSLLNTCWVYMVTAVAHTSSCVTSPGARLPQNFTAKCMYVDWALGFPPIPRQKPTHTRTRISYTYTHKQQNTCLPTAVFFYIHIHRCR